MNYLIEQALRSKITGLSFIERYGGIVRPITYKDAGKVPVSTLLTADQCKDPSFYKLLVPDSDYKSISYFEVLNNSGPVFEGPKQSMMVYEGSLRFVCWLNLRALGIADAYNPERFSIEVMNAIKGRTAVNVDGIQGEVQVLKTTMGGVDPKVPFGRYSYSNKERLFFNPYGFFYFDIKVQLMIGASCIAALSIADPLTCYSRSGNIETLRYYYQKFTTGPVLTWTQSNGHIPTSNTTAQVMVFQNGQKLIETDSYTIARNTAAGESELSINGTVHYDGAVYEVIVIQTLLA